MRSRLWPGGPDATFASAQMVMLGLVPIVFVAAASRGGFARTGDIAELGVWLGVEEAQRPGLRDAQRSVTPHSSCRSTTT